MTASKSKPPLKPTSDVPHPVLAPRDPGSNLYPEESPPFRKYGYWSSAPSPNFQVKPIALILFSGRARPGDLHQSLAELGWRVCSIDTKSPRPTNILDEGIWDQLRKDLDDGIFDYIHVATPCGTFSPLREKQPGPRPLRSVEHIAGLPKSQLTQSEQKQLKEANIMVSRSATAVVIQRGGGRAWTLENPEHPDGKPTAMAFERVDLSTLDGLRCNHEKRQWTSPSGKTYEAAHESAVQRWRVNPEGVRERASVALGEYTEELSKALAGAAHATQRGSAWLESELRTTQLP